MSTWTIGYGGRGEGYRKIRTLERAKRWDKDKTMSENAKAMGITPQAAYGLAKRMKLQYRKVRPQ